MHGAVAAVPATVARANSLSITVRGDKSPGPFDVGTGRHTFRPTVSRSPASTRGRRAARQRERRRPEPTCWCRTDSTSVVAVVVVTVVLESFLEVVGIDADLFCEGDDQILGLITHLGR